MKGQVVADFIVDHAINVEHSVDLVQLKPLWRFLMGQFLVRGREPSVWSFPLVVCT
jgi:hypothetical protein